MMLLLHLRAHSRCSNTATRDASLRKENPAQCLRPVSSTFSTNHCTLLQAGHWEGVRQEGHTCALLLNKQMGGQWKQETMWSDLHFTSTPNFPPLLTYHRMTFGSWIDCKTTQRSLLCVWEMLVGRGASGMKMTSTAGALTSSDWRVKKGPHAGPIKLSWHWTIAEKLCLKLLKEVQQLEELEGKDAVS